MRIPILSPLRLFGILPSISGSPAAALSYKIATADDLAKGIREVATKKIGTVYVTDADGSDPWDRLPRYWPKRSSGAARRIGPPGGGKTELPDSVSSAGRYNRE